MSWKTIDEFAGGSIQKYHRMVLEDMKHKGVPFTADAAIPAPGELLGDQQLGYEAMSLGGKFWSWWTKKELRIFESQVVKELKEKTKEEKLYAQTAALPDNSRKVTLETIVEDKEQGETEK